MHEVEWGGIEIQSSEPPAEIQEQNTSHDGCIEMSCPPDKIMRFTCDATHSYSICGHPHVAFRRTHQLNSASVLRKTGFDLPGWEIRGTKPNINACVGDTEILRWIKRAERRGRSVSVWVGTVCQCTSHAYRMTGIRGIVILAVIAFHLPPPSSRELTRPGIIAHRRLDSATSACGPFEP